MSETPDLSTLPKQMRYAAKVLQDAVAADPIIESAYREAAHGGRGLRALLCNAADRLEQDERDIELETFLLTQKIYVSFPGAGLPDYNDLQRAVRCAIEQGWRRSGLGQPARSA